MRVENVKSHLCKAGFALLAAWIQTGIVWAQDVPYSAIYQGAIAAASNGTKAAKGDIVQVLNATSGVVEASGSVEDDAGTYVVSMSKPSSFNNTQITFKLVKSSTRYDLLGSDGKLATIAFSGSFLPVVRSLSLTLSTVGRPIDNGTGNGGNGGTDSGNGNGSGSSTNSAMDVTGDGKVDDQDVQLMKRAISGQIAVQAKFDVNKDGVFNTRDVIEVIRASRANPDPGRIQRPNAVSSTTTK